MAHFVSSAFELSCQKTITERSTKNNIDLTHYQTTDFRLFQTERVCRRHFKFDKNGRKLSKWVENTMGKGEIARYKQFLLFPQSFQKACFPGASKGVVVWEWVNPLPDNKIYSCPNWKHLQMTNQLMTNQLIF